MSVIMVSRESKSGCRFFVVRQEKGMRVSMHAGLYLLNLIVYSLGEKLISYVTRKIPGSI